MVRVDIRQGLACSAGAPGGSIGRENYNSPPNPTNHPKSLSDSHSPYRSVGCLRPQNSRCAILWTEQGLTDALFVWAF